MEPGAGERVDGDALLADYLVRVRRAARRLPHARREWVVGRAGDRIAMALDADEVDHQAPDVAAILVRLGEPQELVQSLDGHVPGDEARWVEYLAVLLLVIGGLAFLPAWAGGAVLLWASPRWQLRERLIGTLIWPGGLTGFTFLAARPQPFISLATSRPHALFWLLLAVLGVVQAVTGIWLLRQARGPELRYPWDPLTAPGGGTDQS